MGPSGLSKGLVHLWDTSIFTVAPPCSPANWNGRHKTRQVAKIAKRKTNPWKVFSSFLLHGLQRQEGLPSPQGHFLRLTSFFWGGGLLQDPIPEIRGWLTSQDRRRHGSPQLVPGCRHQLGQVPLRLLLSSAGGQARQGKTSEKGGGWTGGWVAANGRHEKGPSGLGRQVLHTFALRSGDTLQIPKAHVEFSSRVTEHRGPRSQSHHRNRYVRTPGFTLTTK